MPSARSWNRSAGLVSIACRLHRATNQSSLATMEADEHDRSADERTWRATETSLRESSERESQIDGLTRIPLRRVLRSRRRRAVTRPAPALDDCCIAFLVAGPASYRVGVRDAAHSGLRAAGDARWIGRRGGRVPQMCLPGRDPDANRLRHRASRDAVDVHRRGAGADEDRQGKPFVGRAGQLLTDMITKGMGLTREQVYIANVLKCRPPENRTPTELESDNCIGYLEEQISIIRPEFICLLGRVALARALEELRGDGQGSRQVVLLQGHSHDGHLPPVIPAQKARGEAGRMARSSDAHERNGIEATGAERAWRELSSSFALPAT